MRHPQPLSAMDKLKELGVSAPTKLIHSLRPEPKVLYESLTGQSLYPDPFKSKPVRDIGEHLARVVSMDKIYKWAMGKPSRGFTSDLVGLLSYTSDPGEIAYYGMKSKLYDWVEDKTGESTSGFTPDRKSNALYYYKQAFKYGDEEAIKKYYDEYIELGGSDKNMAKSIKRSAPLGGLSKKEVREFKASLDKADMNALNEAIRWYNLTYKKNK